SARLYLFTSHNTRRQLSAPETSAGLLKPYCLDLTTFQRDLTTFIRVVLIAAFVIIMATSLRGQQPPAPSPNQGQPPPSSHQNPLAPSPNRNPPTRLAQPGAPTSLPSAPPTNVTLSPVPPANSQATPLAFDEALRLALAQPSKVQQNQLNEFIAAEDVRQ